MFNLLRSLYDGVHQVENCVSLFTLKLAESEEWEMEKHVVKFYENLPLFIVEKSAGGKFTNDALNSEGKLNLSILR